MLALQQTDIYQTAEFAIAALFDKVTSAYDKIPSVPMDHTSAEYQRAILPFVAAVNDLEDKFRLAVFDTAQTISEVCRQWQQAADYATQNHSGKYEFPQSILELWHRLSLIVEKFSEHPTKKTASLITENATLLAFSANRIPEGVQKFGDYYLEKIRKDYIVCSERNALAQLMGLHINTNSFNDLPPAQSHEKVRTAIRQLTTDIIDAAPHHPILRRATLHTTVQSCDSCAAAIIAARPHSVVSPEGTGTHFTRHANIQHAIQQMRAKKINLVCLSLS